MKMRKALSLVLSMALIASLAACGQSNQPNTSGSAQSNNSAGNSSADGSTSMPNPADELKEQTLIFATYSEAGAVEAQLFTYLGDALKEATDGKIKYELYTDSMLGSDSELLEQLSTGAGTLHATVCSMTAFDLYCPQYNVFSVPYVYPDNESVSRSMNGLIGEKINEALGEHNIQVAGQYFRGNRQLTSNKLIETPDDLKGLKLRMADNVLFTKVWTAEGATCIPIASSEIFTALQTGVADAQENSTTTNYNRGIYEVQKYNILTNHIVDWYGVMFDKSWLESLPEEYQTLFLDLVEEACEYASKIVADSEQGMIDEMEEKGMTTVHPDVTPFQKIALSCLDDISKDWDQEVYQQMLIDVAQ